MHTCPKPVTSCHCAHPSGSQGTSYCDIADKLGSIVQSLHELTVNLKLTTNPVISNLHQEASAPKSQAAPTVPNTTQSTNPAPPTIPQPAADTAQPDISTTPSPVLEDSFVSIDEDMPGLSDEEGLNSQSQTTQY